MKKFIFPLLILLSLTGLRAQDGSLSPYGYYGYGDLTDPQIIENAAMGHLNFPSDSIHYNFLLPSSLGNLRYVNYSAAVAFHRYDMRNNVSRSTGGASLTPYVAMGIPIGKGGLGFGFRPYATTGYYIRSKDSVQTIVKTGEGGMNTLFVQAGYRVFKGFSIGAAYSYYFGNKVVRTAHQRENVLTITRQIDNAFFSGSALRFSADYTLHFGKDNQYFFQTGAMYRLGGNIASQNTRTLQLIENAYGGQRIVNEQTLRNDTTALVLPSKFSIGAGVGKLRHWFVGLEYETDNYGAYSNDFFTTGRETYRNGSAFKLGGYWRPDARVFSKLWKRTTYKAGIIMRNGFLAIDNQPVNQFGTTFGLSIPLGNFLSNVNVDLEYLNRGTMTGGLVKENIFKLKIGFSFNDKWFQKRKIR